MGKTQGGWANVKRIRSVYVSTCGTLQRQENLETSQAVLRVSFLAELGVVSRLRGAWLPLLGRNRFRKGALDIPGNQEERHAALPAPSSQEPACSWAVLGPGPGGCRMSRRALGAQASSLLGTCSRARGGSQLLGHKPRATCLG